MRAKYVGVLLILVLSLAACDKNYEPETRADANPKVQPEAPSNTKTEVKPLAYYETPLLEAGVPRKTNIRLAAERINKFVLKPGKKFSFNAVVGERTAEKGYKKATIFSKGQEVKEVGGGICQLSTTIYNAAVKAGFKITERHEHQQDVEYVPEGKDATVYYDHLDLRFINTHDTAVKINCELKEEKVSVTIIPIL
jgi:vancomycin resistance protein YoaR